VPSFIELTGLRKKSFNLLWRGSRDGFDASDFHRLCDGRKNTLLLIKNTESNIFGGYASQPWSSPSSWICKKDMDSFLFTFKNSTKTPLKLKVINIDKAVFHISSQGPNFGVCDLDICSKSNKNRSSQMKFSSFKPPLGKNGVEGGNFVVGGPDNYFQTSEIEVFQVI